MNVAFIGRKAGRGERCGECRFAVLRAAPYFALVGRVERGGVDRLHRGVIQHGTHRTLRSSWWRLRSAAFASPFLLPTKACSASRPAFSLSLTSASTPSRSGLRPIRSASRRARLWRATRYRRRRRPRVADLHHFLHALHAVDLAPVEARQLAAEHRALLDRGVEHAGHLEVHAVNLLAGGLVAVSRRAIRLPTIFQSFGSFSATSFGGVSLAAASATLPYVVVRPGRRMRDHAVCRDCIPRPGTFH